MNNNPAASPNAIRAVKPRPDHRLIAEDRIAALRETVDAIARDIRAQTDYPWRSRKAQEEWMDYLIAHRMRQFCAML